MKNKRYAGRRLIKKLIIPFCLVLVMLVSAKLQAQETGSISPNETDSTPPLRLSPDEAVERALRNNLGLESARAGLSTKRRASNLSWNQFIPNITVAGVFNRDNEARAMSGSMAIEEIPLNPLFAGMLPPTVPDFYGVVPFSMELPQWQFAGNIQASLSISAAMFFNMKRLRLDYETGVISYEKAKLQLERDVRKAYHNLLLLQENLALIRGSFTNVERQVQMAQANYNAGLAPELTVLQARVARENMRPMIDQVENGLKLSMAQFAMFLGMDYNTEFELIPVDNAGGISSNVIPLDVSEMITKAANGKPDIQELRQTILMLKSARRAQIYSLTPALSLSWNNTSAYMFWKDTSPAGIDKWSHTGAFSITFALRLHSLIPWSGDFQGIYNMDDQIKTATIGLAQMINGTEIEVYNTVLSLQRTQLNTQAQAETVRLAEQSYRLTEQAYRAGLQDYFQVQNAEQSLRQSRVQLLEQQFNYLNGLIDLEYSIGVPFGTLSGRSKQ